MTLLARAAGARLVVAGTALACLTMLVGGCGTVAGSSASSAGSASAAPAGSASADGPASGGSAASPPGVLTPAPATTLTAPPAFGTTDGVYPCPLSSVKVTLGLSQGTQKVTYQVIDFTNRGSKLCALSGYPGISLAGGNPLAQIGLAATWPTNSPPRVVILNPGQSANSLLQISHASTYPRATCDPVRARYLVIAVPNTIGFVKLAYRATACAKPIEILSISGITLGSGN